jgi:hypothetical protein
VASLIESSSNFAAYKARRTRDENPHSAPPFHELQKQQQRLSRVSEDVCMPNQPLLSFHKKAVMRRALWSGTCASFASLIPLFILGRKATGHWTPAPNAISHWLWGKPALHKKGFTWRHTATGIFIHHAASIFWAIFFEAKHRNSSEDRIWLTAAATSAIACLVDYQMTPRRLDPGFEHHLSRRDLAIVYSCFAAGLAAAQSTVIAHPGKPSERQPSAK